MSNIRTEMIDAAVGAAGELVGFLQEHGMVTPAQAQLLVMAACRAKVSNVQEFEVRESVKRVAGELERGAAARGRPYGANNESDQAD